MRLRYLLVVAGVLTLASQGLAQGCEGWNTSLFFLSATPAEIESCLAAGAEVNARSAGLGYTPLHWAVRFSDNPAVITSLLDAGADVNARGEGGWTPLHYAARFNDNPAVITALLDAGANTAARNTDGETPWDFAQDNEALRGTDAYWRLNEGRFR